MKSIDIDKTIVELLKQYQVYVKLVVDAEKKKMETMSYKNAFDREAAEQDLLDVRRAYNLFKKIVQDPRYYLYRKTDIVSTGIDNTGALCNLAPGIQTISDKLMPLHNVVNQNGFAPILHVLSGYIALYIRNNGIPQRWIYNGGSDFYAEYILRLNKTVNLMGASAMAKRFKEFLPERMFAVKFIKGK